MRRPALATGFLLFCLALVCAAGPGDIPVTRWVSPDETEPITYEEWRAVHPSTAFRIGLVGGDSKADSLVEVVVNTSLFDSLTFYLDPISGQYVHDLRAQGYGVRVDTAAFSSGLADAESLRAFFQSLYANDLAGVVLVGDLPVPWYQMMDNFGGPPYDYEEFPIDLFYMDLDGIWEDTLRNSGGSLVPGSDSILDTHYGNMAADIWVGRLTVSPLGDELALLRNYFDKDHAYRCGLLPLPDRALVYVDDDWYSSAGRWSGNVGLVYTDRTTVAHPETTIADDYRGRLTDNYEWISVFAHSSPEVHGFKYNGGASWSWFWASEIPGIDPHGSFYNLFACSNARFVESGYMGGRYIFTDTYGLGAVGSTKTGSMLEFQDFYYPLSEGKCLGDGLTEWFARWAEAWGDTSRSWFYGMTMLGDPTLCVVDSVGVEETQEARSQRPEATLLQNYPNPFGAGGTTISFDLKRSTLHVSLRVYDVSGRLVKTLFENERVSNVESPFSVFWDGRDERGEVVGSGVYLYRLVTEDFTATRKTTLLR